MAEHTTTPELRTASSPASFLTSLRFIGEAALNGLTWLWTHEDEIRDFLAASRARAKDPAWKYLLDRAPGTVSLGVVVGLELSERIGASPDQTVGELLEVGFTNPRLVEQVSRAVDRAALNSDQKDQLQRAVGDFSQSSHHLAVPLFINTLEGIFWRSAEEHGLIERNRKGKWEATTKTDHPGKTIGGVESLFSYDQLGLDGPFESFLLGLVYGGVGDPYRHGTPTDGWRLRSLCLFVALIGWLETHELIESKSTIRRAFTTRSEGLSEKGQTREIGG